MLNRLFPCLSYLFFLLLPKPAHAQDITLLDTSILVLIQTTDGNEFVGKIRMQNDEVLVLQTETFGELTIQQKAIKTIRPVKTNRMANGRYWFDNPYAGRYFAGTSGYGLRKGEGSFDNGWVFMNQVSYGISDHFSIGGGTAPFILFGGPLVTWLTPKFSIPLQQDKFNLAIGGLYGYVWNNYEADNEDFGAVYSQLTFGSRDANLTLGAGFGFSNGRWTEKAIYSLSGAVRVAARLSLIAENYLINDGPGGDRFLLFSGGVRFMSRVIAIDAGLVTPFLFDDGIYPLPWLGLHVPFGSGRK